MFCMPYDLTTVALIAMARYTLGNSVLILAYSGAIILHGPHHLAVKSSTVNVSALAVTGLLACPGVVGLQTYMMIIEASSSYPL